VYLIMAIRVGGDEEGRPLPDTLEIIAHLIYLARHTQSGSDRQLRCLDLAAEMVSQARHHNSFAGEP
jgi:hypothetical protein